MTIPVFSGYAEEIRDFLGMTMELPQYVFRDLSLITGYVNVIKGVVDNYTSRFEPGSEIIFAGHSLGGGLAKILSVMTGYKAVAISGPGITATQRLYKLKDAHIANSFVNIVPHLDPIAGVDRASGSSFLIPCEAGLFACHDVWRSQCMLATLCGKYDQMYDWCSESIGSDEMKKTKDLGDPYTYHLPWL
jgi:lipase ATG15